MPFVAPKSTSTASSAAPNAAGRTTFRPPWVKDEPASTVKTSVPWAKKTSTSTATADKGKEENGAEKPTLKKATSTTKKTETTKPAAEPTKKVTDPKKTVDTAAKKTTTAAAEPAKKVIGTTKKAVEPAKKAPEPVKKAPEPVKKVVAPAKKTVEAVKTPAAGAAKKVVTKKKEPTPPTSSSEEEESEEEESEEEETEEEETEEEESEEEVTDDSGEETDDSIREVLRKAAEDMKIQKALEAKKKQQQESELDKRFTLEKPKLRPVMVKRDKSTKNVNGDDDDENGDGETEEDRRLRFKLEKPKLRHVKREEKPLPAKSTENMLKFRPTLKKVSKIDEILKEPKEEPKPEFKTKTLRKTPSIKREPSIKNVPAPPPLPSLVPKAPPPPPPPLGPIGEKRELTPTKKAALDKLKTRPRRRPDWSEMMKEVESGKKLRHVECNDRSQPILTCKSMTKVDDKFIYETEKDKPHNKLLKQIQGGVKLKPTKTNDRSKPILDGLRKFRRQMTIEEQLQKSQSKINMLNEVRQKSQSNLSEAAGISDAAADGDIANPLVAALILNDPSGDELDDIDKIRDDLQSTKQMLALELRNREAKERENKKLLAKIATLEAELEREKSREKNLEYGSNVIVATMDPTPAAEDIFVANLKKEAEEARKHSKELEKKYHDTGELLDEAKAEIEEQRQQIKMLEKKLGQALQGGSLGGSRRQSEAHLGRDSSPEFDLAMSESDPDEPEEKKTERRERRLGKEVKVLRSKLTKLKVKEEAAKKEKVVLKQAIKKNHIILKEENKKFKKLEKEVHKMAASMKEDDDDDEEKDEEDEDEEAAEEESEEEEDSDDESEESESEESGAETESESEAEDASNADKKSNLEPRVKKHEGRLSAAKKCNVLLQANVDNIQDEISQIRSKASNLQAELDSVLADLGL